MTHSRRAYEEPRLERRGQAKTVTTGVGGSSVEAGSYLTFAPGHTADGNWAEEGKTRSELTGNYVSETDD